MTDEEIQADSNSREGEKGETSSASFDFEDEGEDEKMKEVEALKAHLAERDHIIGETKGKLDEALAQLTAKEEQQATMGAELTTLKAQLSEAVSLSEAKGLALSEAVAKYKASVLAAKPEIPGEMISGESITEIDDSLETAKALRDKVALSLLRRQEQEAEDMTIPAGAPPRTGADLSTLSPREKIEYALRKEA